MTPRQAIDIQLRFVRLEIKNASNPTEKKDIYNDETLKYLSDIMEGLEEAKRRLEEFENLQAILKRITQ